MVPVALISITWDLSSFRNKKFTHNDPCFEYFCRVPDAAAGLRRGPAAQTKAKG
jgi:hypothetical protein